MAERLQKWMFQCILCTHSVARLPLEHRGAKVIKVTMVTVSDAIWNFQCRKRSNPIKVDTIVNVVSFLRGDSILLRLFYEEWRVAVDKFERKNTQRPRINVACGILNGLCQHFRRDEFWSSAKSGSHVARRRLNRVPKIAKLGG